MSPQLYDDYGNFGADDGADADPLHVFDHPPFDPDDYYDLDMLPDLHSALPPPAAFTFAERLHACVAPTALQFGHIIAHYLLINAAFVGLVWAVHRLLPAERGAWRRRGASHDRADRIDPDDPPRPMWPTHCVSIVCGTYALHHTYADDGLAVVAGVVGLAVLAARVCQWWAPLRCGPAVLVCCMVGLAAGESWQADARLWHRLRGTVLVVAMKVVSVAYMVQWAHEQPDAKEFGGRVRVAQMARPDVLQVFGYVLWPATCVFGPWTPFGDYRAAALLEWRQRFNWRWLRYVVCNAVGAFVCLLASNCAIASAIGDEAHVWLVAYRDAASFRFSHYFVTYLGQMLLMAGGSSPFLYGGQMGGCDVFGLRVVEPWYVEVPRSLVRVVVVWNRSMHIWLKTYVFRQFRYYGTPAAIAATYAHSAILHGLNFQLAAVLLSLGLFTYIEHSIRQRLATIFNACIAATACADRCGHAHKWRAPAVLAFNAGCTLLAMWNLAYLGLMFAGQAVEEAAEADAVFFEGKEARDAAETGFSYAHTMARWRSLGYASHLVMVFVWVCFKFV